MIRRVFTRIEMIINAIEGDLRLPGNPQILLLDIRCSPTMPSSGDVEKAAHMRKPNVSDDPVCGTTMYVRNKGTSTVAHTDDNVKNECNL